MDIESAIQHYLVERKDAVPREQVELELSILARLQEYLAGDERFDRVEALGSGDLLAFIRSWYRDREEVTPETARQVAAAVTGFAAWLDRQWIASPERSPLAAPRPALAPALAPFEEALPHAARAAEALRRFARREDLASPGEVGSEAASSPLGLLTGGATRVMRPAEIDYASAEEDTFRITEIGERSLSLLSPAREQLGEGPATPVPVPAGVARLLRVGDILHAEIAPAAAGWEILHVETVYPGGLDDRP